MCPIQKVSFAGKTLVNFSGGINSTLMLIWTLKINPADSIIVHYCEVKNNMNGWESKTEVARNLIERLYTDGFKFDYVQTAVDIRNIKHSYDLVHVINMASAICKTDRDIDETSFGFINQIMYPAIDYDGVDDIFGLDYGTDDTDDVDIIYPMYGMNKEEIELAIIDEGYSGIYNT